MSQNNIINVLPGPSLKMTDHVPLCNSTEKIGTTGNTGSLTAIKAIKLLSFTVCSTGGARWYCASTDGRSCPFSSFSPKKTKKICKRVYFNLPKTY